VRQKEKEKYMTQEEHNKLDVIIALLTDHNDRGNEISLNVKDLPCKDKDENKNPINRIRDLATQIKFQWWMIAALVLALFIQKI
jgi:hypothetical protein